MENVLLLLMLVAAIAIGWWLGRRERSVRLQSAGRLEAAAASAGGLALRDQSPNDLEALAESLQVSPQTVETHLELGRLCRRRGEAGKAVHIHQRLLESAWLSAPWALRAKLELARDYYSAGLLDRAESLLQEIVEGADARLAGKAGALLLNIYEQERDWEQAIHVASLLRGQLERSASRALAHYHCEIAEEALAVGNHRRVARKLGQALREDPACARALMLSAESARRQGHYQDALDYYRLLAERTPDYLGEVLSPIAECYAACDDESGLVAFLREIVDGDGPVAAVLLLAELMGRDGDNRAALQFVTGQLQRRPSLRGLLRLVELQLSQADGESRAVLDLLRALIQQMIDGKAGYQCSSCGFSGTSLHWHCPRCHEWGVVRPARTLEAVPG